MKKLTKNSRINDLMIDVVEYAFTEWLVRRGIFSAFEANYERAFAPYKSFRDRLRSHIRHSLHGFGFKPSHLVTTAFLFTETPEGPNFWNDQSAAWKRFCSEFIEKL